MFRSKNLNLNKIVNMTFIASFDFYIYAAKKQDDNSYTWI